MRSSGFDESKRGVDALFAQHPELVDSTQGSWNVNLKQELARGTEIAVDTDRVYTSLYRPFFKQRSYFAKELIDRQYQLPSMFPTLQHKNIGIETSGTSSPSGWSVLVSRDVPDVQLLGNGQYFPRFTWEPVEASDGGLFGEGASVSEGESSMYGQVGEVVAGYVRKDNITDEIKALYRDTLGADVTGDDIFHFVYGKLHDPGYREKYAADLKKMLPHIETPTSRARFDQLAVAGRELMDLHVNYEDVEPWPVTVDVKASADKSDRETWRVQKMKWAKKNDSETGKNVDDVTTLVYNKSVTVRDIPAEADEYMLGARSALAWIIDRYRVKKDKASGIVNDPNDWADEVGNPRYIVDLIAKVTRVAVETVRIVESIREDDE